MDAEVVLKESNLNLCSLTCANTNGFNCKSFDFCPLSKTCLLNSGSQQISQNTNANVATDSCSNYKSKKKKRSDSIVNSSSNSNRLFHFVFIFKGEYFPVTNQNINNGVKLDDNSESKFTFFK